MPPRTSPPFRADHVGSLLRPPELRRARDDFAAGKITAGPDACEDCLVPKDLMRGILSKQLGVDGDSIDIAYPVDLPGYSGSGSASSKDSAH